MADNQIREMISAFAAGCMDRENFIQFREYMAAGGSLPKKELGELQNTMALVPIILELEKPAPELKNKVAKKLLSLQDEIKAKIKEKKKRLAEQKERGELSASEADIEFPDFEPTFTTKEIETLRTIDKKRTASQRTYEKSKPTEEKRKPSSAAERKSHVSTQSRDERTIRSKADGKLKRVAIFGWVTAGVFLIISIAVYFFMSSTLTSVKEEFASKEKLLSSLQKELAMKRQTEAEYKELLQFLKNRDNYIVELSGGEQYPNALGRLIISFRAGDGVLILENPPAIEEDEVYQLWMLSKGKSLSLGTLSKDNNRNYYFIYNIPKLDLREIDLFRITNEPKEGSVVPFGNTLLYGNVPEY